MNENQSFPLDRAPLVQEYGDIGENLRHYGNLQFAQFTIYCALAVAALSQLYGEKPIIGAPRIIVCVIAAFLGIMFLLMSVRVGEYWNARVERAKAIEACLNLKQYSEAPKKKFVSNRTAVSWSYGSLIFVFILAMFVLPC